MGRWGRSQSTEEPFTIDDMWEKKSLVFCSVLFVFNRNAVPGKLPML